MHLKLLKKLDMSTMLKDERTTVPLIYPLLKWMELRIPQRMLNISVEIPNNIEVICLNPVYWKAN